MATWSRPRITISLLRSGGRLARRLRAGPAGRRPPRARGCSMQRVVRFREAGPRLRQPAPDEAVEVPGDRDGHDVARLRVLGVPAGLLDRDLLAHVDHLDDPLGGGVPAVVV